MQKKANILVVDDELGVRQSFSMVLKKDYNVLLSESGKEAIDSFSKNSIDIVLLDIIVILFIVELSALHKNISDALLYQSCRLTVEL